MKEKIAKLIDLKSIITLSLIITLVLVIIYEKEVSDKVWTLFATTIGQVITYFFRKVKSNNDTGGVKND